MPAAVRGGSLPIHRYKRFERKGTHQVTSVNGDKFGPAPRPDFTKPVDFFAWAAHFISWGSQKGQPPRVRRRMRFLQMFTETTP